MKSRTIGPYLLGPNDENQGIYVGDAMILSQDIPDESVDLILLDPPFGINFKYSHQYKDNPKEYPLLLKWIVQESNRIIKPSGYCFIYISTTKIFEIWSLFPDNTRLFINAKNFVNMGKSSSCAYAYDSIFFWQKEPITFEPRGRDWFVSNTNPSCRSEIDNVDFHSCPRPLNIILHLVETFSEPGDCILDMFIGSGTTGVASKLLNRYWLGFEIDADMAIQARSRIANINPLFTFSSKQLELPL